MTSSRKKIVVGVGLIIIGIILIAVGAAVESDGLVLFSFVVDFAGLLIAAQGFDKKSE